MMIILLSSLPLQRHRRESIERKRISRQEELSNRWRTLFHRREEPNSRPSTAEPTIGHRNIDSSSNNNGNKNNVNNFKYNASSSDNAVGDSMGNAHDSNSTFSSRSDRARPNCSVEIGGRGVQESQIKTPTSYITQDARTPRSHMSGRSGVSGVSKDSDSMSGVDRTPSRVDYQSIYEPVLWSRKIVGREETEHVHAETRWTWTHTGVKTSVNHSSVQHTSSSSPNDDVGSADQSVHQGVDSTIDTSHSESQSKAGGNDPNHTNHKELCNTNDDDAGDSEGYNNPLAAMTQGIRSFTPAPDSQRPPPPSLTSSYASASILSSPFVTAISPTSSASIHRTSNSNTRKSIQAKREDEEKEEKDKLRRFAILTATNIPIAVHSSPSVSLSNLPHVSSFLKSKVLREKPLSSALLTKRNKIADTQTVHRPHSADPDIRSTRQTQQDGNAKINNHDGNESSSKTKSARTRFHAINAEAEADKHYTNDTIFPIASLVSYESKWKALLAVKSEMHKPLLQLGNNGDTGSNGLVTIRPRLARRKMRLRQQKRLNEQNEKLNALGLKEEITPYISVDSHAALRDPVTISISGFKGLRFNDKQRIGIRRFWTRLMQEKEKADTMHVIEANSRKGIDARVRGEDVTGDNITPVHQNRTRPTSPPFHSSQTRLSPCLHLAARHSSYSRSLALSSNIGDNASEKTRPRMEKNENFPFRKRLYDNNIHILLDDKVDKDDEEEGYGGIHPQHRLRGHRHSLFDSIKGNRGGLQIAKTQKAKEEEEKEKIAIIPPEEKKRVCARLHVVVSIPVYFRALILMSVYVYIQVTICMNVRLYDPMYVHR